MLKIGIIGYGYVGKALADRLSEFYNIVCYECDKRKIDFLNHNKNLILTNEPNLLAECCIFIITVQTPVDDLGNPNLKYIIESTEMVSKYLSKGDIVVYESTVYPGVTETVCGNIIEEATGFELNKDFYLAYSPERISPGDEEHSITNISKIVSASNVWALEKVKEIYSKVTQEIIVTNTIMEAEAAKLLENLQRDINIALMNEYSIVMRQLGIDLHNVIDAANSKWNFNYYLPGFVGGHCIGIDTQYYIKVANDHGIEPKIAKVAREINEKTIVNIADIVIEHLEALDNKRVCIAGITYKENIDDLRNSAALKVARKLENYGCDILLFDPLVNINAANDMGIRLCSFQDIVDISVLVCIVYHDIFDSFRFNNKIFKVPEKAIVIDPYSKLSELEKYNKFVI